MQFWLELFSIVAAIALVVQVVILTALFFQLRGRTENVNRLVGDLHSRVRPHADARADSSGRHAAENLEHGE